MLPAAVVAVVPDTHTSWLIRKALDQQTGREWLGDLGSASAESAGQHPKRPAAGWSAPSARSRSWTGLAKVLAGSTTVGPGRLGAVVDVPRGAVLSLGDPVGGPV